MTSASGESPVRLRLPGLRLWTNGALVVVLWLSLIQFPIPPQTTLDASWQETLAYAHAHHWQFGRELVFTWGPWGFLNNIYQLGDAAALPRLAWELAGKAMLAGFLVYGVRRAPGWRRLAFVTACVLVGWLFTDVAYVAALVLGFGILVAEERQAQRLRLLAAAAGLAFLAQIKFTYALLSLWAVGGAVLVWTIRRRWSAAGLVAGAYALGFAASWLAAGQSLSSLWPYLQGSWEISVGYASAMALEESWPVFLCGVAVLGCLAVHLWRLPSRTERRAEGWIAALFLAGVWFASWKHGFTRADGHVWALFLLVVALAPVMSAVVGSRDRWPLPELAGVLALTGAIVFDPAILGRAPGIAWSRLLDNARGLTRVASFPAEWRDACVRSQAESALPEALRQKIGSRTVDLFNYNQGAVLLSGLNYTPRPVFQSYSVYTPRLEARNLAHYRSKQAPDFVLWRTGSIDGRFPAQDDAPLVPELARRYQPVLSEGDYLLLENRGLPPGPAAHPEVVLRTGFTLGHTVELPPSMGYALWLRLDATPTRLGRLRAGLYKPAPLYLAITDDSGRTANWRLVPAIARDGFLLQPLLENNADVAQFFAGSAGRLPRSVRVSTGVGQEEYWAGGTLELDALTDLPLQSAAFFQELLKAGITNLPPTAVTADHQLDMFPLGSTRALFAHADCTIEFTLPADCSEVSGGFGLRPGAYQDGGNTDGVDFAIEAVDPTGRTTRLWSRYLDPVHAPADRGNQHFHLALAAHRGEKLRLLTRSGPARNTNWDWSYWSALRFSPAPVSP